MIGTKVKRTMIGTSIETDLRPLLLILCPSVTDALWWLNGTAWPEYRLQPEAKKSL